ncbi:MAG: hypothetical protein WC329_08765, partial [Candidatus Omnitrophota bacterium]
MKKSFLLAVTMMTMTVTGQALAASQAAAASQDKAAQVKPKEAKVDRNYDGVIDRIEYYDSKGTILRVETDTNNDGKMDEWVYYE